MKRSNLIFLIATVAILVVGLFAGIIFLVSNLIFKSEPVLLVLQTLEKDPDVTNAIGTPVELKLWGGSINIKTSGVNGSAEMVTTAYGPKGKISFESKVIKKNDIWEIWRLDIYPNSTKVTKIDKRNNIKIEAEN